MKADAFNIAGMHKLTTLDYPGVVSAILFTQGCNFHCPYCHNSALIPARSNTAFLDVADILAFLKKRQHLLDGLVISGGEPTLQQGLYDFCNRVKNIGYKVKLDTNGSRPDVLGRLLDAGVLDYVAMDCKTVADMYCPDFSSDAAIYEKVRASANLLRTSGVRHEFRTTCAHPYISDQLLPDFVPFVGTASPWFLQKANIDGTSTNMASIHTEQRDAFVRMAVALGMQAAAR